MDKKEAMEKIKTWFASREIELSSWDCWYIENLMKIVAANARIEGMREASNILISGSK